MRKSQKVAKDLQQRRMRAGRLLLKGVALAEVARRVGVTRMTVSTWNRGLQRAGLEGLKAGVRGRPSKLSEANCSRPCCRVRYRKAFLPTCGRCPVSGC